MNTVAVESVIAWTQIDDGIATTVELIIGYGVVSRRISKRDAAIFWAAAYLVGFDHDFS